MCPLKNSGQNPRIIQFWWFSFVQLPWLTVRPVPPVENLWRRRCLSPSLSKFFNMPLPVINWDSVTLVHTAYSLDGRRVQWRHLCTTSAPPTGYTAHQTPQGQTVLDQLFPCKIHANVPHATPLQAMLNIICNEGYIIMDVIHTPTHPKRWGLWFY